MIRTIVQKSFRKMCSIGNYNKNIDFIDDVSCSKESSDCNNNNTKRHKQSTIIAAAACLVFMSGGTNIAWSLGFTTAILPEITKHLLISWFGAAIIGAIIGSLIANRLQTRLIVFSGSLLVLISGALFASLPEQSSGLLAARYLDGIANGLIFAPILMLFSELAHKDVRGQVCCSIEALSFTEGITLQIVNFAISTKYEHTKFSTQTHGLVSIILGSLPFLIAYYQTTESPISPISIIDEQKEVHAWDVLPANDVQFDHSEIQTSANMEKYKQSITMDKNTAFTQTIPATLKLCFFRGMCALSFSALTTSAILMSSKIATDQSIWPYIVFALLRWISTVTTVHSMDTLGRKVPMLLGFLFCGGLAIVVGVVFGDYNLTNNSSEMCAVMTLIFVYQFFAGFAHTASSTYLGEAFPLTDKPYYIAFAFIVEMMVQILVVIFVKEYQSHSISHYFYALGVLYLFSFLLGFLYFPETKNTTVRDARSRWVVTIER